MGAIKTTPVEGKRVHPTRLFPEFHSKAQQLSHRGEQRWETGVSLINMGMLMGMFVPAPPGGQLQYCSCTDPHVHFRVAPV